MDTSQFKHIVGDARQGERASIRFFGRICEESVTHFNEEFDFLENSVRPSLIRVLINSEGGSVLHGMSAYSTIRNSSIPTECVNEGMAASMGSVLWAAGDRSLMRDYSILMIHNPFLASSDARADDMVAAFTKQIRTIYRKRFGLEESHVEAIMAGQAGRDGTFFDAEGAVEAGIISAEGVLPTSAQLCQKVRNELSTLKDYAAIQQMMTRISAEALGLEHEIKPSALVPPILNRTHKHIISNMSEAKTLSPEYSAVAASLGMKDNYEVKDVMSRISELITVESKLKETEKSLNDTKTVVAGKETAIRNLQTNVNELSASLKVFQDKEAAENAAKIEALVEAAVTGNKIDKADKAQWIEMAGSNYTLAESILSSIPPREQISREVATDPANVQAAATAAKTAEQLLAEKVSAVVGDKFEFRKLD